MNPSQGKANMPARDPGASAKEGSNTRAATSWTNGRKERSQNRPTQAPGSSSRARPSGTTTSAPNNRNAGAQSGWMIGRPKTQAKRPSAALHSQAARWPMGESMAISFGRGRVRLPVGRTVAGRTG